MKKLFLVCSLLVVFLGLGFNTQAQSVEEPSYVSEVTELVSEANDNILALVVKAQEKANELGEKNFSEEKYNKELDKIIERVIKDTNKVAERAVSDAASLGFEVEIEWVNYEIGNRVVAIDPICVIGWGVEIVDSTKNH